MSLMKREEWYDLTRATNWTPKYVKEDELLPEEMSGGRNIPLSTWDSYDEPYKVTYSEYVGTQREKDAGIYSVKAALSRSKFMDNVDPGWEAIMILHYGGIALGEYAASIAETRMARFSKAPGNRNMATYGMLDENRHGQHQLYFPHTYTNKNRQWDWAWKSYHTNQWAAVATKNFLDDIMMTRDAVATSIMLTFSFETGFTNMQFLGLAADAAETGDHTFASLISSIQTDESRHAQQGGPTLKILIANGKKEEAQQMVDISIWKAWRLFSVLTGPIMDYYTPLEHRKQSFKEFMEEWIISQFERQLLDIGLDLPWYWDEFINDIADKHHGMHMGSWFWRPTLFWNPTGSVGIEERKWLEEKYPGWNATYGKCWDVIIDNINNDKEHLTLPETLPVVCNFGFLPLIQTPNKTRDKNKLIDYQLEYEGRLYHFNSEVDKWAFQTDPNRYKYTMTLVDEFLAGMVQPPDLNGALAYMGLTPGEIGSDAHNYAWAKEYK